MTDQTNPPAVYSLAPWQTQTRTVSTADLSKMNPPKVLTSPLYTSKTRLIGSFLRNNDSFDSSTISQVSPF